MQIRLREEIDGDFGENYVSISDHRSGQNSQEITCGICCATFYADKSAYESICRAIEQGLDNPFLCDDCQQEYDELSFRDH